jgi:hypothetical protein
MDPSAGAHWLARTGLPRPKSRRGSIGLEPAKLGRKVVVVKLERIWTDLATCCYYSAGNDVLFEKSSIIKPSSSLNMIVIIIVMQSPFKRVNDKTLD